VQDISHLTVDIGRAQYRSTSKRVIAYRRADFA
jgi:hypothetical protein